GVVEYYLREATKDEVRITVADSRGNAVRTLKAPGRVGLNRVSWDLRMEPPVAENAREAPLGGGAAAASQGPLVLAGSYAVTVNLPGRQPRGALPVEGDPRVPFSDADRRTRQAALLKLYELQKALAAARMAVTAASSQS